MQVGILGPLEVRDDAGRPLDVAGARLRALLARLALDAGRPVGVAALVDCVWGEQPPADAANALQTLVSRLRRALGDGSLVAQSPAGYRLAVAPDGVDAHRFEQRAVAGAAALRSGDAATATSLLRDALALWRGPALADIGASAEAAAARLHGVRLTAQLDRVAAELELGRPASVVGELDALLTEHPLNERAVGLLLTALAATGRQAEALATYERVRARLADELGIDPSPELRQAHLAVLRGEVTAEAASADPAGAPGTAAPAAHRTNLKAQLTSFVGREDEVARIGKSLEASRLVTLVGPGGAGKTRLASEAAAGILDRAPDGVWLVELASVTDAADVPQTVLGSLGLREAHLLDRRTQLSARDATSRLLDGLAGKQTVLVLDNCEHLVDASARLADHLLARCPQLRILATSREPLGIFGETLLVVPPLGQPPPDAAAAEALEYPAVRLFADRAAAVRPDFTIDDAAVGTVIEIVRRLDGLPLAIELAAARLRSLPLAEIAGRLSDRFRLLTGGSRTALPRHRTLRAVVEWSWELLAPAERLLAERLAVFPAGATPESAGAVCAGAGVAADELSDLLALLIDKSLLQPVAGGTRLRMLETIREYGLERLAERQELAEIRRRHAEYFTALVREAEWQLRGAGQLAWVRLLEVERDNVLAALRFLADDGRAQQALEVAAGIGWHWMLTGAHTDAATWLAFALEAPGDADPDLRLLIASMMAITAASVAAPTDAAEVEAGFRQLQELGGRFRDADVGRYPMLALMRPVIAMFSGAGADLDEAVAAAVQSDDRWIAASALMFRANIAENSGDVETVRSSIAQARAQFELLGERWGLASCLQLTAQLHTGDGELDAALADYEEALRLVRELGAHEDTSWLYLRIADVHVRRGDLVLAREYADTGQQLTEQAGSAREAPFGRLVLADVTRRLGDLDTSRRLRDEALRRLEQTAASHPLQAHATALTLAIAAKHELLDGQVEQGRARLHRAHEAALGTRDMPVIAAVGTVGALFAEHDGDPADAAERLGAAERLRGTADRTQPDIAELTARLRGELGDAGFLAAYERGRTLPVKTATGRLAPA